MRSRDLLLLASALSFAACAGTTSNDDLESIEWNYRGSRTSVFLSQHGLGDRAESTAYLTAIGVNPSTFTLTQWKSQFIGTSPVFTAFYQNVAELGFWRDMTCTQAVGRGVGGCMVTNWGAPDDPTRGVANKGTVAMTLSAEGFVRFYVFLPDGTISPSAVLDGEGPKFAPRMCTVCHSGTDQSPAANPDLGAVFREFEPTSLHEKPGVTRATAEAQWKQLNRVVQDANRLVRTEAEGAPPGTDHARQAIIDHIAAINTTGTEPVPQSWTAAGANAVQLWQKVVTPYCMACHRHNSMDWSDYGHFKFLQRESLLRTYLPNAPDLDSDAPAMPQSSVAFDLLSHDTGAKAAVDAWLAGSGGTCTAGQACVPTNPCHVGTTACNGGVSSCQDSSTNVANGTSCGTGLSCSNGACVTSVTPTCNTKVLLIGDSEDANDAINTAMVAAVNAAGLTATLVKNHTSYAGTPSANGFGAIYVSPGRTYSDDMASQGQDAVVAASNAGAGVVFTEWAAYELTTNHYQKLKPLILVARTDGAASHPTTFTLTGAAHPVFTGLGSAFTTTGNIGFSPGTVANGGVAIAKASNSDKSTDAGVVVKDGATRLVHLNHTAAYTSINIWASDPSSTKLFTNAIKWAAHCL
jgi:hypothetical protein